MKIYQNLASFYDLLYSYRDYDKETEFLLEECEYPEASFLDVGCGTGSHLMSIRKKRPLARLSGIDINKGMLDVAEKKGIDARLKKEDMRSFELNSKFDIIYCFSSSIQYNLNEDDFKKTLESFLRHSPNGKIIFDLAFCKERWIEGYTNITANSNEKYQVAEMFTTHSKDDFSFWNPLYLIKDNETGEIDMEVDKHKIRLWRIPEIEKMLINERIPYKIERGFDRKGGEKGIPIFVLNS